MLQQSQINSDVVYNVEIHTLLITDVSISIELVHFHLTQKVICMLRFLCCFLVIPFFCFVGVSVPESIPGWSLANRTLRNITNNSDMQPVNRPVNTGHVRNVNQCSYVFSVFFSFFFSNTIIQQCFCVVLYVADSPKFDSKSDKANGTSDQSEP